jgi:ribose transport system ATP-binding protein
LGGAETERLFSQIARLKADGVSLIYISHRLDEIARIADRIVVLRDGNCVAQYASADVPVSVLLRDMVGRTVDRLFPIANPSGPNEVLRVEGLTSRSAAFRDISFCVNAGEIFGIAGIIGAGRTELVRSIVAADPLASGRILIDGKLLQLADPAAAIHAGIVLVPEDRKLQGLILQHSVADNLTLGNFDKVGQRGWFRPTVQLRLAQGLINRLAIKCSPGQRVRYLSGGNQQKTMVARWIAREPKVFILDEPTRGIDVGARAAIYRLIVDLARTGMAVVIVSSDIEEVLGLSHRIMVMARGRQMGVLDAADADAVAVMALATG